MCNRTSMHFLSSFKKMSYPTYTIIVRAVDINRSSPWRLYHTYNA